MAHVLPTTFLRNCPDAKAITVERIDLTSLLPENAPYYATVLDDVLSATECAEILRLAVENSRKGRWEQASVNSGMGKDMMAPDVRLSERIIWDNPELVERIWARCILATGIMEKLGRIEGQPAEAQSEQSPGPLSKTWEFSRLNGKMSFLKYSVGQYFKSHSDGHYITPSGDEASFYTFHLYLSGSVSNGGDVKGGATRFHSMDMTRSVDVDPKVGRILIFNHDLVHSGAEVEEGIKYTMRTDLMYRRMADNRVTSQEADGVSIAEG